MEYLASKSEKIPASVLLNGTVGTVAEFGFKIATPTNLIDVPTVRVDLSNGSTKIECRAFQDRPPHEGFNHLKGPFLPWAWSNSEEPENSRLAFVLSQDFSVWTERMEKLSRKEFGEHIKTYFSKGTVLLLKELI